MPFNARTETVGGRRDSRPPRAIPGLGGPAPIVLVVDESEAAGSELTRWLLAQGVNAVAATSCLEATAVLRAVPIDGLIGNLALWDGSFFDLAQLLRATRRGASVVIGYADVNVRPPPELDACFVRPLDLAVLGPLLGMRFGRRPSGEPLRISHEWSVPAARLAPRPSALRRHR